MLIIFQSTLPARGATELRHNDGVTESMISIHAPRTGSDLHGSRRRNGASYFNPRSPHGERQINPATMNGSQGISIHAPRTGSDTCGKRRNARVDYFNPRSPHGERLESIDAIIGYLDISIHAPRTGSDFSSSRIVLISSNFNPRSPHGERPSVSSTIRSTTKEFQSTLPARGATDWLPCTPEQGKDISIHAPRTGSDK